MFVATVKENDGLILTDKETGKVIEITYSKIKNKKKLYIKCDDSINIKIFKHEEKPCCENKEDAQLP